MEGDRPSHSFNSDGQDGIQPYSGLVMDHSRNLYGTTYAGGAYNLGTVFQRFTPTRTVAGLRRFCIVLMQTVLTATNPYANLVLDKLGNLYGTTYSGGSQGEGTVFELSPSKKRSLARAGYSEF